MNEAHEGGERLLATQGDASEAFELVEEALDLMTLLVECPIDRWSALAGWIGLDLRLGLEIGCDECPQPIGIISGVRNDMADAAEPGQQAFCLRAISSLTAGRMDAQRQAERIDRRMQLGCQAAARTADRGSLSPPFAPDASAWTLQIVLSIRTYSKSGVSANVLKRRSQTPA